MYFITDGWPDPRFLASQMTDSPLTPRRLIAGAASGAATGCPQKSLAIASCPEGQLHHYPKQCKVENRIARLIVKAFGQCRRSHFRKWNDRQCMDKINGSTGTVDHDKGNDSMQAVKRMTDQQRVAGGAMIPEDRECTRLGGALGRLGGVLEASWGHLGASWGVLGRLGASWGRPGAVLEASWRHLEGVLGASWGVLWASWGRHGLSWGVSGRPSEKR